MASRVLVNDKGLKAQLSMLAKASRGKVLTVGVHAAEGSEEHKAPEGSKGSPLTVSEIATIHEYGLGHNPERSFIRDWFDAHRSENQENLRLVGIQVLRGQYTVDIALGRLGALFQGQIQNRISAGIPPPLSKKTIDRKESSVPLINTGQLRSSILWKVHLNGEDE